MWKIRHGLTSNDIQINFVDNNRHGTIAKVPPLQRGCKMRHRSVLENSFAILGPRIWNCIPGHIRKWVTLDLFKRHLTTFVLKVPDQPPIRGYSSPNSYSILDWRNEKEISTEIFTLQRWLVNLMTSQVFTTNTQVTQVRLCYSADHISSFRFNKNKAHIIHCTSSHTNISPNTRPKQNSLIIHCGNRKLLPNQKLVSNFSEHYSISNIMKHLKNQFKNLWKSSINVSSKLSFYQGHKLREKSTFLSNISALHNNRFQTSQTISGITKPNIASN